MAYAVENIITFRASDAPPVETRPEHRLTADKARVINALRGFAQRSQLASRADLDAACATIAADRAGSIAAYALSLFGHLAQHASQPLHFHRPGSATFSDSEVWLSRTLTAAAANEMAQLRALIAWRVRPIGHRRALFLLCGLADGIFQQDTT
ncbi:MAG: hypothetical protein AAFQ45_00215 [Pseudomonadota bacterium]